MRLTLEDISIFAQCPKYYRFSRNISQTSESYKLSIIEKVIKKAYIKRTEYEKLAEWRVIMGWVDKEVFEHVDVEDEESFNQSRKLVENILVFLQKWYEFDYIRGSSTSYIDLPIIYDYGNVIVSGRIPLLKLEDIPIITYIDELEYDDLRMYSNIKVMGWACMLLDELDIEEIKVRHFSVGPNAGIKINPITVKRLKCKGVRDTIGQIASSISRGVSYPSHTSMCNSCQFKRSCRL